ncbi:MAG: DUF3187 family protein [Pseudomonadota bacterium]
MTTSLSTRNPKQTTVRLFFVFSITLLSTVCTAQNTTAPLTLNNRTPFTQIFMAPIAPDLALSPTSRQLSTQFDLTSHSLIQSNDIEQLEIDGETYRLAIQASARIRPRLIVHAEAPFFLHGAGFIDRFIDDWHALTQLPEGERPRQPQDALLFGYRNNDEFFLVDRQQQGIGDLQFAAAYQLQGMRSSSPEGISPTTWLQIAIKLPTGRYRALTGSEAVDIGVSIHHTRHVPTENRSWSFNADVFFLHVGDTPQLSARRFQWQTNLRAALNLTDTLAPEAQLRYRSAAYNSNIPALGDASLSLDAGVYLTRPNGVWRFGISEDLNVDSAPDITFYAHFSRRYGH